MSEYGREELSMIIQVLASITLTAAGFTFSIANFKEEVLAFGLVGSSVG